MKVSIVVVIIFLLVACTGGSEPTQMPTEAPSPTQPPQPTAEHTEEEAKEMETGDFSLISGAFEQNETIPVLHTCDGANTSPRLGWSNPPEGTASFALIFDDPDAPVGTWVHWVVYNIPPERTSMAAEVDPEPTLGQGMLHGSNSWGSIGYGGPCPPGGEHRYFFKLFALDNLLDLEAGATAEQVVAAMEGHILAQTELMGTYSR